MITTDDIKAWLKKSGKTRQDLADAVGLSKGTINNWLSGADPIPAKKLPLIKSLMANKAEEKALVQVPLNCIEVITIRLTREEYERCLAAADAAGLSLEDWARSALGEKVDSILQHSTPKAL